MGRGSFDDDTEQAAEFLAYLLTARLSSTGGKEPGDPSGLEEDFADVSPASADPMAPHLVALSSAGSKTMQRLTADPCEKVTGDLLLDLAEDGHDAPFRQHLMSTEEETQVVAMYLAGATATEVAAQFGAHRLTVSRAVRRAGSRVGREVLTQVEVERAAMLHATGLSLADVAKNLSLPR